MTLPNHPPTLARLVVDSSYHPIAYKYGMGKVRVTINGHERLVDWGPAVFDLPAGRHHLEVGVSQIDFGHSTARTVVDLYPGQQLIRYYRAPASLFHSPTIGSTPPARRGRVVYGWVVAAGIIGVAAVVGAITAALLVASR